MACKVFIAYPIYWVVYGQMINNFVSQAGTMNTHGIPNDIMQNIDPIAVIIFIPIMERVIYPAFGKFGIQIQANYSYFLGFYLCIPGHGLPHLLCSTSFTELAPVTILLFHVSASEDGTIPNNVDVAVQTPAYFFRCHFWNFCFCHWSRVRLHQGSCQHEVLHHVHFPSY